MQLRKLKLLSSFRGLPKGFRLEFSGHDFESFQPICLVGLNGSGKSNILEAIAEIFYYLENCFSASYYSEKYILDNSSGWGFEISYFLSRTLVISQLQDRRGLWNFIQETNGDLTVGIKKVTDGFPVVRVYSGGDSFLLDKSDYSHVSTFLPSRVVGYSSGMNELLSNTFVKMDFKYLDNFVNGFQEAQSLQDNMNRMFFMNYDSNKYITVANFLFDREHFDSKRFKSKNVDTTEFGGINLSDLKRETRISDIEQFSISLVLEKSKDTDSNIFSYLPSELEEGLEKLKSCATLCEESVVSAGKDKERKFIRYDYWVNHATKHAFQDKFGSASELYKTLYYLQLLNNRLVSKATRNKILTAEMGTLDNLSDEIPKFENNKLVFRLHNFKLKKNKDKTIEYRKLSDGEHQLLQVMGTLLLMDDEGVLFLFDEPETHFNPEWRSKFVKLVNSSFSSPRVQQLLLTTHSPFIISDSKPENVFLFKRNRSGVVQNPITPNFNTFGASVNKITRELFDKEETLSELALEVIEKIKNMPLNSEEDILAAKEASRVLGDSPEKILLFRELILQQESLKKDD